MIRIVAVVDTTRVVYTGDLSTISETAGAPGTLVEALSALYAGDNVAAGKSAWNAPTSRARSRRYVLTRDAHFDVGDTKVRICRDATELIDRFETSNDELVIVGGLSTFRRFTPHASRINICELRDRLPTEAMYDEWDTGDFELVSRQVHLDYDQLAYRRKHSLALNNWFKN